MSDLDKKLREILKQYFGESDIAYQRETLTPEAVAQIKQAFADAGWGKIYTPDDEQATHLMTGSEWLERFEKEIGGKPRYSFVYEAARRASGVDDE